MSISPCGAWQILWGKTDPQSGRYHPLFCHMLDVGMVAAVLLGDPNARHHVERLASLMGIPVDLVPRLVSFLISLHDIGKASPSFEMKSEPDWARVRAAGFLPNPVPIAVFNHGLEAWLVLPDLIPSLDVLIVDDSPRVARRFFEALALGLGSHHGTFFAHDECAEIPPTPDPREPWHLGWCDARRDLVAALRAAFGGVPMATHCRSTNLSAMAMYLCGLTVLCDWIGSDEEVFVPWTGALADYPAEAERRARRAVGQRELLSYLPEPTAEPTFASLFPNQIPRPMQTSIDEMDLPDLASPMLAIIEAPTGEGKTEAALLLARRLAYRSDCRGIYFALPTMAASNQMYGRMHQFLARQAVPGHRAGLLLVHGQAGLARDAAQMQSRHGALEPEDAIVADSWLMPRKRSMLAPYGVGTIDQAMMGALNVRYGTLRLFGLAGKVVILDEIHAYDLYMSNVIDRLLAWLCSLGACVVLLSATLPRRRREQLIAAFVGTQAGLTNPMSDGNSYPLVTLVGRDRSVREVKPKDVSRPRSVTLDHWPDGPNYRGANAARLLDEIADGGCAAWICNTVGEAQRCFRVLQDLIVSRVEHERPDLLLFHARTLREWRREQESVVVDRFGEDGRRPVRAILVATQVVEQSLDLDFDLIITQLAPIDLLLQRIGRLQRHDRSTRPLRFQGQPRAIVLLPPEMAEGRPEFGAYGRVYQPWVLLRTLAALRGWTVIKVPGHVRYLIELVYDEERLPLEVLAAAGLDVAVLDTARQRFDRVQAVLRTEAVSRLLGEPDASGRFAANQSLRVRDEEQSESDAWFAAQTRYSDEPSVRVVLLDRSDGRMRALRHALAAAPTRGSGNVDRDLLVGVLDASVSISSRALVEQIKADGDDRVMSLDRLRGLKGVHVIALDDGLYSWSDAHGKEMTLKLDRHLGVLIGSIDTIDAGERS